MCFLYSSSDNITARRIRGALLEVSKRLAETAVVPLHSPLFLSGLVRSERWGSGQDFLSWLLNQPIMPRHKFSLYAWNAVGKSRMNAETTYLIVGVDDDFRVRESLASLLESAGYRSSMFASAEEFLRSVDLGRADCLVSDLRMPGMNGVELARSIRATRPELPIIFISAHLAEPAKRTALQEGALGLLYKPFDAAELLELIRAALLRRRES